MNKIKMLLVSGLVLSVFAVFAAESKITTGSLSLGRQYPGAKGSLKKNADGDLVLAYDFTNGGRFVGAEINLPGKDLDDFKIVFEPQQRGIRASVVVMQPSGSIETKRRHFPTGTQEIVINNDAQFLKPGADVDGSARKVLFKIEKSSNAPIKGEVILKSIVTAGDAAASGSAKITAKNVALGREFPGAKARIKKNENGESVLTYDFANGGRYISAELPLPAKGMTDFTVLFDAQQQGTRISVIIPQADGRVETKRRHYSQGVNEIAINDSTQFMKPGVEIDGSADKVIFRIENSANAPVKGSVTSKSIKY